MNLSIAQAISVILLATSSLANGASPALETIDVLPEGTYEKMSASCEDLIKSANEQIIQFDMLSDPSPKQIPSGAIEAALAAIGNYETKAQEKRPEIKKINGVVVAVLPDPALFNLENADLILSYATILDRWGSPEQVVSLCEAGLQIKLDDVHATQLRAKVLPLLCRNMLKSTSGISAEAIAMLFSDSSVSDLEKSHFMRLAAEKVVREKQQKLVGIVVKGMQASTYSTSSVLFLSKIAKSYHDEGSFRQAIDACKITLKTGNALEKERMLKPEEKKAVDDIRDQVLALLNSSYTQMGHYGSAAAVGTVQQQLKKGE